VFDSLFDQVTPENNGKWQIAEKQRGQFRWEELDAMYEYAERKSMVVKQHTFVWGMQYPEWIESLPTDTQRVCVENWFTEFFDRYGTRTDLIDVVNEPITFRDPPMKEALGGAGKTGWDWVIESFKMARRHASRTGCSPELILNEHGTEKNGGKADQFLSIVEILQDSSLIDAIGLQGHWLEDIDTTVLHRYLDRVAEFGLPVYVSELDISIADDQQQLASYKRLFPVLWNHPAVKGITLWGFVQGRMWRGDGYLVRSDGTWRPALEWLYDYVYGEETRIRTGSISPAIGGASCSSPRRIGFPQPRKKGSSVVCVFRVDGKRAVHSRGAPQCLIGSGASD
jgi:endo-1,4-beta-xylanase